MICEIRQKTICFIPVRREKVREITGTNGGRQLFALSSGEEIVDQVVLTRYTFPNGECAGDSGLVLGESQVRLATYGDCAFEPTGEVLVKEQIRDHRVTRGRLCWCEDPSGCTLRLAKACQLKTPGVAY
ncbi:MAG: hypothetical protein Q7S44_03750 [bacterium]|nr:hypothetical protein [bacterium]